VLGDCFGRRGLGFEGVEWEGEKRPGWDKQLAPEVGERNAKAVAGL